MASDQRSVRTPAQHAAACLAVLRPAPSTGGAGEPSVEVALARPVPLRSAAAVRPVGRAGRGPQASSPSAGRRGAVRPGARPARADGPAAARPVQVGCPPEAGHRGFADGRPARCARRAPLRLTGRGRRLVAGLSVTLGLLIAAGTAVAVELVEPGGGLHLAGSSVVVVRSGDTLWSLAQRVAPEEDPRAVVDAIVDLNGLHAVDLVPGMQLRLP